MNVLMAFWEFSSSIIWSESLSTQSLNIQLIMFPITIKGCGATDETDPSLIRSLGFELLI